MEVSNFTLEDDELNGDIGISNKSFVRPVQSRW